MATVFVQELGDIIEWTATADITSDDFVDVGGKLGVALASAATGDKVSVKLTGVIRAPKDGSAYTAGDSLNASTSTNVIGAGGDLTDIGVCTQDAGAGDATILCRLNG